MLKHQNFVFYLPTNATQMLLHSLLLAIKNGIPSHFIRLKVMRHSQENEK